MSDQPALAQTGQIDLNTEPDNERPETFYHWTPTGRLRVLRHDTLQLEQSAPIDTLQQEWLNPSTQKRVWVAVPVVTSHEPAG